MADIVQLNKEMVDSFTINFENKVYNFTKIQDETLKGFQGITMFYIKENQPFISSTKRNIPFIN